jgi:urea carboxylase
MADQIAAWKAQQREAMSKQLQLEEESLARLEAAAAEAAANGTSSMSTSGGSEEDEDAYDAPGLVKVTAGFTANVWEIKVKVGEKVTKDQTLMVLEAMKMESPVAAPVTGVVKAIKAEQGSLAAAGALLVVLEQEGEGAS